MSRSLLSLLSLSPSLSSRSSLSLFTRSVPAPSLSPLSSLASLSSSSLSPLSSSPRRFASLSLSPLSLSPSVSSSLASPDWLQSLPPTRVTVLPNGLTVATEENIGETATVGVYINAGSAYENDANNGVAHFVEHMSFKGTPKRSQRQMEEEIENRGASLNAYTSREQTAFIGHATMDQIPNVVEILSDILQNSLITEEAVEVERGVILTEMKDVNNRSEEYIFDLLHLSAFQGSPLGYTILGPEENIRSLTKKDLHTYIKGHYTADRMYLIGSGALSHEEQVKTAQRLFSSLPAQSASPLSPYDENVFKPSMVTVNDPDMEVVHIVVAHEGVDGIHNDQFVFAIIRGMLGGWDRRYGVGKTTSEFCERVAVSQLAHSLMPFHTIYRRTSLLGVYAICKPEGVREVCRELFQHYFRLADTLTEEDVERAKRRYLNQSIMQYDNTTSSCEDMGRQFLMFGRRMSLSEMVLRMNSVTLEDVRRVTRDYLIHQLPAVAVMGPMDNVPSYDELLAYGRGQF